MDEGEAVHTGGKTTQPEEKNKEIVPFATTRMDPEGIMLSEIRERGRPSGFT